ncbi:MAG TPA: DUF4350 domain-containing protein [Gemmatimonadales bacterium]|nr:DUF4350 domain-containing protein [Gemmatimonadales bacterium]
MRPRTELGLSAGLLFGLGMVVVALGSRRPQPQERDSARSSYLTGPGGAHAFVEGASRLGVDVERWRRPLALLPAADSVSPRVVAVLGPTLPLTDAEARVLADLPSDLLLAGPGAAAAMQCYGYRVSVRPPERPARTRPMPGATRRTPPHARAVLVPHENRTIVDTSSAEGRRVSCKVPEPSALDTILRTARGRPVVLRLRYPDQRVVTLVADDRLFRNSTLRYTSAGELTLGLVAPRYRRMVVDEYHHGYRASGSLAGAALGWSTRSPWGWMVWQLAAVGVVALVASGVRFGPVRSAIERRRRSPMEHVRALATALAAARGHDVAVRLMIQGLRRRLSRGGRPAGADLDTWLAGLGDSVRSARGREALEVLAAASRGPSDAASVLAAGNAVETLWEELKPT